METQKIEAIVAHIHHTSFGRVKGQFQDAHDLLDSLQGGFGV
jgi:hypothetical protein